MIVVKVRNDGVTVSGHAGYASKGNDIVCAAVSTLAQALEISLNTLTDDEVVSEKRDGYLNIKCKHQTEQGRFLIDAFFVSISAVA